MSESSPTPEAIHSDAFLARLMRDQLKLSVACALCFAVALVALPLQNYYQPAFMAQRVFGFTLTWLILGVLFFPFVFLSAFSPFSSSFFIMHVVSSYAASEMCWAVV